MDFLLHHFLRNSAQEMPEKEAVVHGDDRLCYGHMEEWTNRIANGLKRIGLMRCDRVGILLNRSVNETLSIFGISKAGGVFVPINALLFPEQIKHIINDCQINILITSWGKLQEILDIFRGTPSLKHLVVVDHEKDHAYPCEATGLDEILMNESAPVLPDRCISRDLCAILYTSGSTGKPKGVMLSHDNLVAGSRIVSTYLNITREERILSILPFSFDYGLNQMITSVEHGGTLMHSRVPPSTETSCLISDTLRIPEGRCLFRCSRRSEKHCPTPRSFSCMV
jgi:acyl-CoA synthetase (AMP-forming)/AMP-acid ligase II